MFVTTSNDLREGNHDGGESIVLSDMTLQFIGDSIDLMKGTSVTDYSIMNNKTGVNSQTDWNGGFVITDKCIWSSAVTSACMRQLGGYDFHIL